MWPAERGTMSMQTPSQGPWEHEYRRWSRTGRGRGVTQRLFTTTKSTMLSFQLTSNLSDWTGKIKMQSILVFFFFLCLIVTRQIFVVKYNIVFDPCTFIKQEYSLWILRAGATGEAIACSASFLSVICCSRHCCFTSNPSPCWYTWGSSGRQPSTHMKDPDGFSAWWSPRLLWAFGQAWMEDCSL